MLDPGSFQRESLWAGNLLSVLTLNCLVLSSELVLGRPEEKHPGLQRASPQPQGAKLLSESDPNNFLSKAHSCFMSQIHSLRQQLASSF